MSVAENASQPVPPAVSLPVQGDDVRPATPSATSSPAPSTSQSDQVASSRLPPEPAPGGRPGEHAVYFRSGAERLFGILTTPSARAVAAGADTPTRTRLGTARSTSLGVLLAHSGVNNFTAHRNGVWTTIAHQLANEGVTSLRFDFTGTGESSGHHVRSLTGQVVSDITAAVAVLRAQGCDRLLLVGSCFGGIPVTVVAALRRDVAAVILLSPPLVVAATQQSLRQRVTGLVNRATVTAVITNPEFRRWYLARVWSLATAHLRVRGRALTRALPRLFAGAAHWPHRSAVPGPGGHAHFPMTGAGLLVGAELRAILESGAALDLVFGSEDGNLAVVEHDQASVAALDDLRTLGSGLGWHVIPGAVHGLEDASVQAAVIAFVTEAARRPRNRRGAQ